MNRFYDRFDPHKWINFSGADYFAGYGYFMMIIFGAISSPKVTLGGPRGKALILDPLSV